MYSLFLGDCLNNDSSTVARWIRSAHYVSRKQRAKGYFLVLNLLAHKSQRQCIVIMPHVDEALKSFDWPDFDQHLVKT